MRIAQCQLERGLYNVSLHLGIALQSSAPCLTWTIGTHGPMRRRLVGFDCHALDVAARDWGVPRNGSVVPI